MQLSAALATKAARDRGRRDPVANLLIDGEHTEAARAALAKDPEWAAPPLWRSEWRNILAGQPEAR